MEGWIGQRIECREGPLANRNLPEIHSKRNVGGHFPCDRRGINRRPNHSGRFARRLSASGPRFRGALEIARCGGWQQHRHTPGFVVARRPVGLLPIARCQPFLQAIRLIFHMNGEPNSGLNLLRIRTIGFDLREFPMHPCLS
jgi:hypothetical protein